MDDVKETRLDNGLMVLTKEMHSAPVAHLSLWYRVGSRNERTGITGISHWVEHMLFKGTPRFGKGELDRLISRNGGMSNAMTSRDNTCYFETLPSDRFDLALEIESDRMTNAMFDAQEVESERTVIISEREGAENYPQFHLTEELLAAAFKVHTYGHEVVGWKCDLQTMTRDDLYNHYRTYYAPNNAVLVLVGDFESGSMLDKVQRQFGGIATGPAIPAVTAVEPAQEGERRLVVRRPGGAAYVSIAFHAPAATDPDFWPLFVLAGVLSGGPGVSGKSARLYPALVEKRLAVDASASYSLSKDPELFSVSATVWQGVSPRRIEAVILSELEELAQEPPTAEEMAKVRKQIKAQVVYGSAAVTGVGFSLGQYESASTYRDYLSVTEKIGRVMAEDVQRVAATYLTELNRTVGWFVPTSSDGGHDE